LNQRRQARLNLLEPYLNQRRQARLNLFEPSLSPHTPTPTYSLSLSPAFFVSVLTTKNAKSTKNVSNITNISVFFAFFVVKIGVHQTLSQCFFAAKPRGWLSAFQLFSISAFLSLSLSPTIHGACIFKNG
jgi:hypothetical protein